MATTSMDITSFVGKLLEQDDVDALREGVRVLAQAVMETEVSSQIGATPYERSSERIANRTGYRTPGAIGILLTADCADPHPA
jgi:putative transposase